MYDIERPMGTTNDIFFVGEALVGQGNDTAPSARARGVPDLELHR